jgi:hypothetical protein
MSNRLLVPADLTKPGEVGRSGTMDKKMSKWFLNRSKSPESSLYSVHFNILLNKNVIHKTSKVRSSSRIPKITSSI